jgi:hypothetical protein
MRPTAAKKRGTLLAEEHKYNHNTKQPAREVRTTLHNIDHVTTRHNRLGGLHNVAVLVVPAGPALLFLFFH